MQAYYKSDNSKTAIETTVFKILLWINWIQLFYWYSRTSGRLTEVVDK